MNQLAAAWQWILDPAHWAGPDGREPITEEERKLAFAQGRRLAEIAARLAR